MSDLVGLACIVVALYLSECMVWARHGAVVLTFPFFKRARLSVLSRALGNAKGAFTLLNPLPPFGRVYVVEAWPFSVNANGVSAFRSLAFAKAPRPHHNGKTILFSAIESMGCIDKEIFVNERSFVHATSPRHARIAFDVLRRLHAATPADRSALLDTLIGEHMAPNAVREKLQRHARFALPLVIAQAFVFASLFIVVPRAIIAEGLTHWPLLVALVYGSVLVAAIVFYVGHRALLPDSRGDRWLQLLLLLPAPTMATRANDKLGRFLLAGAHPLAVVLAALEGNDRLDAVGKIVRDLHVPREPVLADSNEDARRIVDDFRACVIQHARSLLAAAGIDVDALLRPPALATWQVAHCPRCLLPYRTVGTCTDCGVALIPRGV